MFAILSFTLGCFAAGGLVIYKRTERDPAAASRALWIKYAVYFLIVHTVVATALAGPLYFSGLLALIVIVGAYELVMACLQNGSPPARLPLLIGSLGLYLLLAYGLFIFARRFHAPTVIFVYLVVAALDGFSQLAGQSMGRHQLASSISPNKTVEGALGGVAAAVLTAIIMRSLADLTVSQAFKVGLGLSAAGLIGDMTASSLKRVSGIKDFGNLLPGHGGVLDRFDSLFFAAPAFYLWGS